MIHKCLLAVMGVMVSGVAFANCPEIVYDNYSKYHKNQLKQLNTTTEKDGETIYFCQTHGIVAHANLNIEDKEFSLPGTQQLQGGVAHVPFGGTAVAQAPLSVSSVTIANTGMPTATIKPIENVPYPLVGNYGAFNFYRRLLPANFNNRTATCRPHQNAIVQYLKDNASSVFDFSNVPSVTWTKGASNSEIIATAKTHIKEPNGSNTMPVTFTFRWIDKDVAGKLYTMQFAPNTNERYLFCWVNVNVEITLDTADPNFRHSGTFGTKINVMTN